MAAWWSSALLLLWVPGCLSLRGPGSVTGTVGGSLSVRCTYKEEDAENAKYWCKSPCPTRFQVIVKTSETQQEVRKGRVTIRDEPANLTFTVTVEALEEADAGMYYCGVSKSLLSVDPKAWVVLSVSPAPTPKPTQHTHSTRDVRTTTGTLVPPTTLATSTPHSTRGQDEPQQPQSQGLGLSVLLSILALLLLLLGASSLLAWRMVRGQVRAGKNPAPWQDPHQAAEPNELEPCYANVELKALDPREQPEAPRPLEVEYSTVAAAREELSYSTVIFSTHGQDSQDQGGPPQTPKEPETEYSVIQKKR